ncbi:hypothetical protein HOY34_04895 [Xinfangfangia sp. D13-10-4-6]|uniref:MOSC domain-containing protein n=1 Tax=Pseudogemmobacter hezensis TaxID=2737662 RepID=UPI0015554E7B|nr:hypothetical protein [Pseudogemmobacter hezensis]NPD14538.1 hypothetical protein [Pseudogemmobacter hezensis]
MTPMTALMAAIPHIAAAPKDVTKAAVLTFRPGRNLREYPPQLQLTVAHGIPGERWGKEPWLRLPDGSADPAIQVSILPARVHDLVRPDPEAAIHPGDPVIADLDTSEENLPEGSILQLGTALIRVSSVFNDGCVKWKVRYGTDAMTWVNLPQHRALRLRGILCSIEKDGVVRRGDEIRVLSRG